MNNELFRNGSGYADITAYEAMNKMIVRKGKNISMEIYRGDLFNYEMRNSDETKVALIVSADFRNTEKFINVIILTEEQKGNSVSR